MNRANNLTGDQRNDKLQDAKAKAIIIESEKGWVGKVIGHRAQVPYNIAFIVVVVGAGICIAALFDFGTDKKEVVGLGTTLISLGFGFITGKSSK